jgi:hypothetical protein
MNREQAKQVLSLYRPGVDTQDSEVRAALDLAQSDPELLTWYQTHQTFQQTVRTKLRGLSAPDALRQRIKAESKTVRPRFGVPGVYLLAAAAVVIAFLGLALFFPRGTANRFADYQSRMVRGVLREYRMDLVTNDLAQIRLSMASRGAPSEFNLPAGLAKLKVVGGGALKWRNNAVTMVCFDRGDNQMLFFFVMDRTAVKDAPTGNPVVQQINRLQSVSWTNGNNVFVLAGPEDSDLVKKYL